MKKIINFILSVFLISAVVVASQDSVTNKPVKGTDSFMQNLLADIKNLKRFDHDNVFKILLKSGNPIWMNSYLKQLEAIERQSKYGSIDFQKSHTMAKIFADEKLMRAQRREFELNQESASNLSDDQKLDQYLQKRGLTKATADKQYLQNVRLRLFNKVPVSKEQDIPRLVTSEDKPINQKTSYHIVDVVSQEATAESNLTNNKDLSDSQRLDTYLKQRGLTRATVSPDYFDNVQRTLFGKVLFDYPNQYLSILEISQPKDKNNVNFVDRDMPENSVCEQSEQSRSCPLRKGIKRRIIIDQNQQVFNTVRSNLQKTEDSDKDLAQAAFEQHNTSQNELANLLSDIGSNNHVLGQQVKPKYEQGFQEVPGKQVQKINIVNGELVVQDLPSSGMIQRGFVQK